MLLGWRLVKMECFFTQKWVGEYTKYKEKSMEISEITVKSSAPYPEIVGATSNVKTVRVLKNLMSGYESELRAVLQYFFQSSLINKIQGEISDLLEEIAIVEMMHLEMLSHAIVDFGGEPRYDNGQGYYFNTEAVNYTTKLKDALEVNIKGEETAIRDYTNAINMVDNESLKNLFKRIIEDEKLHIEAFNYLKNTIKFLSV